MKTRTSLCFIFTALAIVSLIGGSIFAETRVDGGAVEGFYRIVSSLIPLSNNTYDLGSATHGWKDAYFTGNAQVAGNLTAGYVSDTSRSEYNVKSYGAKGDGVYLQDGVATLGDATFTSATASFTSSDVGKVISIVFGSSATADLTTTIASINSPTSIELTDVSGVNGTAMQFTYGTDDTVAIQAAINAVSAKFTGTVFFPDGTYIINGAFTASNNSQLEIPTVLNTEKTRTIVMRGNCAVSQEYGNTLGVGGAVIYSTRNGTAGTSVLSGWNDDNTWDFTNVRLDIKNLTFRTVSNPVNSCLNLQYITGASGEGLLIEVPRWSGNAVYFIQPTSSTSYGLITPGEMNGVTNFWNDVRVRGFYNHILVGEHCVIDNTFLLGGINGLVWTQTNYGSKVKFVSIERVVNCLLFKDATSYVEIDLAQIEHYATGWWQTVYDVSDTSNLGTGYLNYQIINSSGGSGTFAQTGANNLMLSSVGSGIYTFNKSIEFTSPGSGSFYITNTGGYGATNGAYFELRSKGSSAVTAGSRLAAYTFGGATSASAAGTGAGIHAFATQNWNSTAAGTRIGFYTANNGTTTRTDKGGIEENGRWTALYGIMPGNTTETTAGIIRYDANGHFYGYNGTTWLQLDN